MPKTHTAAAIALYTGMRLDEVNGLRWRQVNLEAKFLTVGHSKTVHGEGRSIPLVGRGLLALRDWARKFPNRRPEHFVFPTEKYCVATRGRPATIYRQDPGVPMGSWKTAWNTARKRSGVRARFHDLRHTAASRMLDSGIPLMKVAAIMGWSPATAINMAKRYGHFTLDSLRSDMERSFSSKPRAKRAQREHSHKPERSAKTKQNQPEKNKKKNYPGRTKPSTADPGKMPGSGDQAA